MSRQCKQDRKTTAPSLSGFIRIILFCLFKLLNWISACFGASLIAPTMIPGSVDLTPQQIAFIRSMRASLVVLERRLKFPGCKRARAQAIHWRFLSIFLPSLPFTAAAHLNQGCIHFTTATLQKHKIISRAAPHWNHQSTLLVVWSALYAFTFYSIKPFPVLNWSLKLFCITMWALYTQRAAHRWKPKKPPMTIVLMLTTSFHSFIKHRAVVPLHYKRTPQKHKSHFTLHLLPHTELDLINLG